MISNLLGGVKLPPFTSLFVRWLHKLELYFGKYELDDLNLILEVQVSGYNAKSRERRNGDYRIKRTSPNRWELVFTPYRQSFPKIHIAVSVAKFKDNLKVGSSEFLVITSEELNGKYSPVSEERYGMENLLKLLNHIGSEL